MKTNITLFTVAMLVIASGCGQTLKNKEILTVDFQKEKALTYEFTSMRSIHVDWESSKKPMTMKERAPEYTEFMSLIIEYTPIEIKPYGTSVIEGKFKKAFVNRTKQKGRESSKRDAVQALNDRTFLLSVGPNGEITDYSSLEKLLVEAGAQAFRPRGQAGLVKEPDMLGDFIAMQWFMWDSAASVKNAEKGITSGQSWKSQLPMPVPMIMKAARNVTYTLSDIRTDPNGTTAVIKSDYTLADNVTRNWPLPYPDGAFQMSGPFGFFRNYKLLELTGNGEQKFNITNGQLETDTQQYYLKVEANMPMGMNVSPKIYIEQTLTTKLIK